MGLFGCFKIILASKWRQNKIRPIMQQDIDNSCHILRKDPWNSLVSTANNIITWKTEPVYEPGPKNTENMITKPGGLSFGINVRDGASFDIFAIPTLPPKRLPSINREDIESLKRPKRNKRKGKAKKSKLTVDEKLAKAKARRERAESEKREKTLRKLKMATAEEINFSHM